VIKVTLTLTNEDGERLRKLCHKRGMTASDLVLEMVNAHEAAVRKKVADALKRAAGRMSGDLFDDLFGGFGRDR
jgi:hypothetical protein